MKMFAGLIVVSGLIAYAVNPAPEYLHNHALIFIMGVVAGGSISIVINKFIDGKGDK